MPNNVKRKNRKGVRQIYNLKIMHWNIEGVSSGYLGTNLKTVTLLKICWGMTLSL